MNRMFAVLLASSVTIGNAFASTPDQDAYVDSVKQWRDRAEQGLKRDNGWLTLAGRFQMKPGANTFGTGADNDIVFPPELKGAGPSRLGTIVVDKVAGRVTLKLADGVSMASDSKPFSGERVMGVSTEKRDWITMGRIAMHIIQREDRFILRLADNESPVRKNFPGRIWYPVSQKYNVDAKFTAYPPGRKIPIVNVIDEVSDEPCPGFVEFKLNGVKHKLDVVGDDTDGLFFVMRDGTSGKTTYRPSRFLYVKNKPKAGETFKLDFNQAYNPPCAFSEFTTCPLPPEQNILKVPIEAGEKYRKLG